MSNLPSLLLLNIQKKNINISQKHIFITNKKKTFNEKKNALNRRKKSKITKLIKEKHKQKSYILKENKRSGETYGLYTLKKTYRKEKVM